MSIFGLLVCKRTSVCFEDRPCDEAFEMSYIAVDRRTTDDPMKNPYIGKAWYEKGRNHRVENGYIARDFDEKRWMVRIDDEAALQSFMEKYGRIILSVDNTGIEPCYMIEIYDDYR